MPFNRLAVYGHRGWASSAIFTALASSGAPVRVIYRPGSDISELPSSVEKVEVDVADQQKLRAALKDIDILISLVGHEGVTRQHAFVKAIPHTDVKLFVPSDLAFRADEQGLRVNVNKEKAEVEKEAQDAGIPLTIILPALFAESSLGLGLVGIDRAGNRLAIPGDGDNQVLNVCTREYIAAAYASIFASTPIPRLQNRVIGLTELQVTGKELATALKAKHGTSPKIFRHSLAEVDKNLEAALEQKRPLALTWLCRKYWATGLYPEAIGSDIWEVPGYKKKSVDDLLVKGQLAPYRDAPPEILEAVDKTFY